MKDKFTYDAFISYKHAELDIYVAENLHKQLESFRLPRNVSKKKAPDEKTRIKRIFRDKDELPIASDLAAPIMAALEGSEFLIVICSPRVVQSAWVKREIETFISLHGREHVLAVLIEGEPSESFPPALLTTEKEFTLEDGTKEFRKIEVEPLAADVRGKTKHEIKKKMKEEILRLAAPMFHCGYDDLKQRHREQKIKHTIRVLSLACIFFMLFGGYTMYQNSQIQKQSKQIQKQSDEIQKQSNEIQKQSDQIKEQYDDILKTSINQTAEESMRLLDSGDRVAAIETALSVLPGEDTPDYPLLEKPQYALSKSLYVYENGSQVNCDCAFIHDTNISFMKLSPSGNRILSMDDTGIVHIFDGLKRTELYSFSLNTTGYNIPNDYDFHFVSDSQVLYCCNNSIVLYDAETEQAVWEHPDIYAYRSLLSDDRSLLAVSSGDAIELIDMSSGKTLLKFDPNHPEESTEEGADSDNNFNFDFDFSLNAMASIGTTMAFSKDNKILALSLNSFYSSEKGEILLLNTQDESEICRLETEYTDISSLLFLENSLVVVSNYVDQGMGNGLASLINHDTRIIHFDYQNKKTLWTSDIPGTMMADAQYISYDTGYLAAESYGTLHLFHIEDGTIAQTVNFAVDLVDVLNLNNNGYIRCVTRDGGMFTVDIDTGIAYNASFDSTSNNISNSKQGNGYIAVLSYLSNQITLYTLHTGTLITNLFETENSYSSVTINSAGDVMAGITYEADTYDSVLDVLNYPSGELRFRLKVENGIDSYSFGGKDDAYLIIASYDKNFVYDALTGTLLATEDNGFQSLSWSSIIKSNDRKMYLFGTNDMYSVDLNTGKPIAITDFPEAFNTLDRTTLTIYSDKILFCNVANGKLEEYSQNDMTKKTRELVLNAAFVDHLLTNDTDTELFVVYRNNDIEVYSLSDFSLIASYTELNFKADTYTACNNGLGDYLLSNDYQACHCSKNHQVKAALTNVYSFDSVNQQFICYTSKGIQAIPLYDINMLTEEANRQLGK